MLHLFYPPRCPVCDRVLSAGKEEVCPGCLNKLRFPEGNLCSQCGKPIAEMETYCVNCRDRAYTYYSGRSALLYNGVMQESIARFKYGGRQEYGAYFGRLLWEQQGEWIRHASPDALVPVPLHRSRLRKRGYNQAQILAQELAKHAGVPVADGLLVRIRNTLPQKDLCGWEREQNLQHAFETNICVRRLYENVKCVILIDDIYTTGSTAEMCSRTLKDAGMERIYVLCLCTGRDS